MKALILSVSAGGGHNHTAQSIKEYIHLHNPKAHVRVLDTLKYVNPTIEKMLIGSYLRTLKIKPSLFGKIYNYAESGEFLSFLTNKMNDAFTYRLFPAIEEFDPDIILCTHYFPAEMLSILKSKHKLSIPTICILTDYAVHNFWVHPFIDAYVVSNLDMLEEMCKKGVMQDQIYNIGIPVNPKFLSQHKKSDTLKELNLNNNLPTLLVMGGSLGMGKIEQVYHELMHINLDIQIIILAGNNKNLLTELNKLKNHCPKPTRILPFTQKVNKYMQACDLLLTKPGGLTITEALVSHIPMGIFSPIPGQEEKNAEFLFKHDLAIDLTSKQDLASIVENVLYHPSLLTELRNKYISFAIPDSGHSIYNLICSLTKNQCLYSQ